MPYNNIDFINFLKNRLKLELPGTCSHHKMAITVDGVHYRNFKKRIDSKDSSVMIILSGIEHLKVLFTLRSSKLRNHSNQISFPGGRNEINECAVDASKRETFEETGVVVKNEEILGELTQLFVAPSNSIITPIICYKPNIDKITINPDEVDEFFWVELDKFTENNIIKETLIELEGRQIDAPFWDVHNRIPLWGATSMIIAELVDLYKEWKDNSTSNKY